MKGRRLYAPAHGWWQDKLEPGDYVQIAPKTRIDGTPLPADFSEHWRKPYWLACTPNGHVGNLANHTVVEHADGTISATPSILISEPNTGKTLWHGWLERGVWREV